MGETINSNTYSFVYHLFAMLNITDQASQFVRKIVQSGSSTTYLEKYGGAIIK